MMTFQEQSFPETNTVSIHSLLFTTFSALSLLRNSIIKQIKHFLLTVVSVVTVISVSVDACFRGGGGLGGCGFT